MQEADQDLKPVLEWMKSKSRPYGAEVHKTSAATHHYWHNWNLLVLQNGVLYRTFVKRDGTGSYLQLIVPRKLRKEVMHQMHNSILSGHLGEKKTREKSLQRFYWFGIRDDIKIWVMQCDECASIKTSTQQLRAPLGQMPVGCPLDRLATDIMGPLPRTPRNNRYILVVTDHFTKWVEVFPVPDFTAKTCASIILNEVISRFGCPCDIHSDQGTNYESNLFQELCQLLEIRKTRTTPANPKCNGQTERFNKTLIRMIKAYLKTEQTDWDLHLGCLAAAYRATPNESTGLTPNLLMLGREVRLPAELMFGRSGLNSEITSYGQYVEKLRERIEAAHDIARKHLESNSKRQKQLYDGKVLFHQYQPGDMVWSLSELKQLQVAPKLRRPYEGPYVVVWKISDLDYVIQFDKHGKQKIINHNHLKPYLGSQHFGWIANALKLSKEKWSRKKM
jgi:hypothetical protein